MFPSPAELTGFLEIAQTLNITKAAQRLGVTQPTLSQSLKRLEASIGAELVIRSKGGVELTVAGKELLKHAQRLREDWERVKSEAQRSTREVRGNVKLGCHPSVGLYSVDLFLPALMKEHPGLEITLVHDLSRKILDKVVNYEIDLGLVINPFGHPDLVMSHLLDDEVKVWRAPGTPTDTLLAHPELLQTQDIMKRLKRAGSPFRRVLTSNSLEILARLTLAGAGCGILPGRVVEIFDRERKLRALPESPTFKDRLFVVHRVENKEIEAIRAIKKAVIEGMG